MNDQLSPSSRQGSVSLWWTLRLAVVNCLLKFLPVRLSVAEDKETKVEMACAIPIMLLLWKWPLQDEITMNNGKLSVMGTAI